MAVKGTECFEFVTPGDNDRMSEERDKSEAEKIAEQQKQRDAQNNLAQHEGETPGEEHRGGPLPNMKR